MAMMIGLALLYPAHEQIVLLAIMDIRALFCRLIVPGRCENFCQNWASRSVVLTNSQTLDGGCGSVSSAVAISMR
jgi:hypothetical protein